MQIYKNSKFIIRCLLIYALWTIDCGLTYAQDAKLKVPGDVTCQTLRLLPQGTKSIPCTEGQFYYDNLMHQPYYCDGAEWKAFTGSRDKTVGTRIVAAWNSMGSTRDGTNPCLGDGSTCDNPKTDYTCDGINDQATIQTAIDDLGSTGTGNKTGGVIYLLEGTYNLSGSIVFNNDGVNDSGKSIIGTGRGTVLRMRTANLHPFSVSGVADILISHLAIDGDGIDNASETSAINFSAVTHSKINKVWIENMGANGYGILLSSNSNKNSIMNNYINNTEKDGVLLNNSAYNIITNNSILNSGLWDGAGVFNICLNNAANNNVISGNYLYKSNEHSVLIGKDSACNNNLIKGNRITESKKNGVYIKNSSLNTTISGNTIVNNGTGTSGDRHGIMIDANSNYNIISTNNLQNNGLNGIRLESANNNIIRDNTIYNNGIEDPAYSEITITGSTSKNFVSTNYISDTAGNAYGIDIDSATCDNNYLAGNQILSWTGWLGAIRDLSTSTKYTDKTKITLEPKVVSMNCTSDPQPYTLNLDYQPSSYIKLFVNEMWCAKTLILPYLGSSPPIQGTILILQQIEYGITDIQHGNSHAYLDWGDRQAPYDWITLTNYSTIGFIWDGSVWLQLYYSKNSY